MDMEGMRALRFLDYWSRGTGLVTAYLLSGMSARQRHFIIANGGVHTHVFRFWPFEITYKFSVWED